MKIKSTLKCFVLALMTFAANSVQARDYYVSSSGSNSNNGTSESTPWQTLSKVESVCNAGTILPGDRILFKKGDSFTGAVIIGSIWGKHAKSGTAASPITLGSYGTGAKPKFLYPTGGSTNVTSRITMTIVGVDYWTFDGLNFTDLDTNNDKITPANCGMALYLGAESEATTNHCLIQNVDVSFCGMGIVLIGDFNKVTGCNLTDFKNLKSTNGGDDDYGANALTIISGDDNEIVNNYIAGAWSASLDYGWNGGACEIFNSCHRNKMLYNTFYDCGGISEFGAYESNATANDNLIAYNKIINCGGLTWCNISGNFAIQVSNTMYYNNVIIENNASRFSGPNTGLGLTATYQALIGPESMLFAYNGSPSAASVFTLKNNVFNLTTGIRVVRTNDAKTIHANNVYKLSGGSTVGVSLASTELSTSAAIFTNTSGADPISWNFSPITGSPVIDFGQNVGIAKDFIGNPVPAIPNSGILESAGPAPALTVVAASGTILCNGGSTTVTVTASGGTAPYTGTGSFTVNAGTFTYTVSDAAGVSATTSVNVGQPAAISVTIVNGSIPVYGGTTNVNVVASGGTGAYTYKLNSGSFQVSNLFNSVSAGNHSVTVKDANGCTSVKAFTLTQPAAPVLIAASTAGTIACSGGTTTVTVTATGGITPYAGTGTFTVAAGIYNYTVTDANGTAAVTAITIAQPTPLNVGLSAGTIAVYGGATTLTATASGGSGAFTYKKNNGAYQSSNIFTGVQAGTYAITVKDANGCTAVSTITITQPAAPAQLLASSVAGIITCNGGTTMVTVSATGGTVPYSGTGDFQVSAGTYNYTVTDANGTTATTSITIGQPAAIAITISAGSITIFGGTTSVNVNAAGGTGGYTYQLDAGSYQAAGNFTSVAAGTHAVTVKDDNGCTSVKNFTLTQPAAPAQLTASVVSGTITCNAGTTTVIISAAGGTSPYTGIGSFTQSAGTYNYTVTDANGVTAVASITIIEPTLITASITNGTILINGGTTSVTVNATGGTTGYSYKLNAGNYQGSNSFSGVSAGNHSITVKDANGCTLVKNFSLTEPAANNIVATATASPLMCNGEIATVTVGASGGTAPYSGTGLFTAYAGTYSYAITDATGATATATITISQPSRITAVITAGTIARPGETTTVTVSATGGTGSKIYKLNTGNYQSSNVFLNVPAGIHTVTVKDANNCTIVQTITITEPTNPNFKLKIIAKDNVNCRGGNSGYIKVLATGGRAPYTYQLNNGRYTSSTEFQNLRAGTYRINAKDGNGNIIGLVAYIFDGRGQCSGTGINGGKINFVPYPNPTTDKFIMTIESASNADVRIEVMNLFGKKVFETTGAIDKNYVFGSDLPAGTYFVKVIQGAETKTTKVIKTR